jgi:hypothetical protein
MKRVLHVPDRLALLHRRNTDKLARNNRRRRGRRGWRARLRRCGRLQAPESSVNARQTSKRPATQSEPLPETGSEQRVSLATSSSTVCPSPFVSVTVGQISAAAPATSGAENDVAST